MDAPLLALFDKDPHGSKRTLKNNDGNGFSVAFISGRLTDHELLDDKYVYLLHMMWGCLAPALEQDLGDRSEVSSSISLRP